MNHSDQPELKHAEDLEEPSRATNQNPNSSTLRTPRKPQERPSRTQARAGTRGTLKSGQLELKHAEEREEPSRAANPNPVEEPEEPSRAANPNSSTWRNPRNPQQRPTQTEEAEEPSRAANLNTSRLRNSRNPQERPTRTQAR